MLWNKMRWEGRFFYTQTDKTNPSLLTINFAKRSHALTEIEIRKNEANSWRRETASPEDDLW
jgi:hypothetical protein